MSASFSSRQHTRTVIKCPTCQQSTWWQDNPHRPFCSRRCRLLDLGCWVEEEYRVPAEDGVGLDEAMDSFE